MSILIVLFGLLSGCLLSVLVGIIGSSRRIGFGLAFLVSLIFTPLVGLIITLLTDPLPYGGQRWGCVGTFVAILGLLFLCAFLIPVTGRRRRRRHVLISRNAPPAGGSCFRVSPRALRKTSRRRPWGSPPIQFRTVLSASVFLESFAVG